MDTDLEKKYIFLSGLIDCVRNCGGVTVSGRYIRALADFPHRALSLAAHPRSPTSSIGVKLQIVSFSPLVCFSSSMFGKANIKKLLNYL